MDSMVEGLNCRGGWLPRTQVTMVLMKVWAVESQEAVQRMITKRMTSIQQFEDSVFMYNAIGSAIKIFS